MWTRSLFVAFSLALPVVVFAQTPEEIRQSDCAKLYDASHDPHLPSAVIAAGKACRLLADAAYGGILDAWKAAASTNQEPTLEYLLQPAPSASAAGQGSVGAIEGAASRSH